MPKDRCGATEGLRVTSEQSPGGSGRTSPTDAWDAPQAERTRRAMAQGGVCPACARNREEARGPGGGPMGRRFGRAEVGDEKEAGLSWALWIPAKIP